MAIAIEDQDMLAERIAAVRRFNRLYTRKIGVLEERHLHSPFSLTEVRVLYELAHRDAPTAAELSRDLSLDPGYMSRLLRTFAQQGFIEKQPLASDGRQQLLKLTDAGRDAFAPLDERSRQEIGTLLEVLSDGDQRRVVDALETVERILDPELPRRTKPVVLRPHRPGDMGWVVQRHGEIYFREYGWDGRFEALVAGIVAGFIEHLDPKRERCWIAEQDGHRLGCVFLVRQSDEIVKLRLLLVEPSARGQGIGGGLVRECVRFARDAGYRTITLWTNDVLTTARRIYQHAGFRLIHVEPHQSFGHDLVGETWELPL